MQYVVLLFQVGFQIIMVLATLRLSHATLVRIENKADNKKIQTALEAQAKIVETIETIKITAKLGAPPDTSSVNAGRAS